MALRLVDEDIEAYGRVSAAMSLPRETESERDQRSDQLQAALKDASMPPFEVMRVSSRIAVLASRVVEIGNPSAISDVGTAALAARSAFHAARLNVEINAALVRDIAWVERLLRDASEVPTPDQIEERVVAAVELRVRGKGG
jgi:formiminotetrahydrofolate cyclodeaminase